MKAAWHVISVRFAILSLSIFTWHYLQPALERCASFELSWILQIYGRNMVMMILVMMEVELLAVVMMVAKKNLFLIVMVMNGLKMILIIFREMDIVMMAQMVVQTLIAFHSIMI